MKSNPFLFHAIASCPATTMMSPPVFWFMTSLLAPALGLMVFLWVSFLTQIFVPVVLSNRPSEKTHQQK